MSQFISSTTLTIVLGLIAAIWPVADGFHVSVSKWLHLPEKNANQLKRLWPFLYALVILALAGADWQVSREERNDANNKYAAQQRTVKTLESKVSGLQATADALRATLHTVAVGVTVIERRNYSQPIAMPNGAAPANTSQPQTIQIAPHGRTLTPDQVAVLMDRLTPLAGRNIGVYADLQDPESGRFARQFWLLFKKLSIDVGVMVGENMYSSSYSPPPVLVTCITTSPFNSNAPEVQNALILRGALIAAGLLSPSSKVSVQLTPTLTGQDHLVELQIGPTVAENP